ncbi:MAG: molybdenum cofactor guanylyltransferase MobA [Thiotrichales bacterium]
MAYDPDDMTGVILAGGQGSRMGGEDKGLVVFRGLPLIEHVLERLRPQVGTVLISANRNLERYRAYGVPIVTDTIADFQGPLAGFAAALEVVTTPWMVTVPCDGPELAEDLVRRLWQGALDASAEIAVAHDGTRMHSVYALMRREVLPELNRFMARGERKIGLWFEAHRTVRVDFSDAPGCFFNLNTRADIEGA